MQRAGMLGFGTDRTTGFPVRVPFGPEDKQTLQFLRFVDNEYILMDLRFGVLGVLCLVALLLSADTYFFQAARDSAHECRLLCAGLGSAMFAMFFVLLTVWLPHDFGALLLWTVGVAGGLHAALPNEELRPATGRLRHRETGREG